VSPFNPKTERTLGDPAGPTGPAGLPTGRPHATKG